MSTERVTGSKADMRPDRYEILEEYVDGEKRVLINGKPKVAVSVGRCILGSGSMASSLRGASGAVSNRITSAKSYY